MDNFFLFLFNSVLPVISDFFQTVIEVAQMSVFNFVSGVLGNSYTLTYVNWFSGQSKSFVFGNSFSLFSLFGVSDGITNIFLGNNVIGSQPLWLALPILLIGIFTIMGVVRFVRQAFFV